MYLVFLIIRLDLNYFGKFVVKFSHYNPEVYVQFSLQINQLKTIIKSTFLVIEDFNFIVLEIHIQMVIQQYYHNLCF